MSERETSVTEYGRIERLEGRELLSVNVAAMRDGRLVIRGTERPDEIVVTINASDPSKVDVNVIGKPTRSFDILKIKRMIIDARGGDDVVDIQKTLELNAYIEGGFGDDTVYGGAGSNIIMGEKGDDLLIGNEANDYLDGGIGNDALRGEGGDDVLFGRAGNDELDGGAGDDRCFGGAGDDTVSGGEDDDRTYGNKGRDTFLGDDDEALDFTPTKVTLDNFGKKTRTLGDVLA